MKLHVTVFMNLRMSQWGGRPTFWMGAESGQCYQPRESGADSLDDSFV